MLGRNSSQANQNLFKSLKSHSNFSFKLRKLSNNNQTKNLVKKWVEYFNNLGKVNAVNVSGTFNTLSKLRIFDKKWQKEDQDNFRFLIVELAEKGGEIYKQFSFQDIANTLNALSKWDVLDNRKWNDENVKLKNLTIKLIEQGIQSSTQFNSQDIANILNALSKWDVLDGQEFEDSKGEFKSLIVKLIKQGNTIDSTRFNSQEIANILNALSKWDVLNTEIQQGSKEECKILIVKLVQQGIQSSTQFNSQDIANTFDALYKFDILDDKKWTGDKWNKIKSLIFQLAEKGQEQKVLENFNSQAIANTFNAFSKLNILDDKWTGNEQKKLKSLIVQLAKRGGSIEGYNLKDIAKIYGALLKWSNDDEFKSLTNKLAEQVQAIAKKQNEEDNILDNIRFASQIINDLPELKLGNFITSKSNLLVSLMECLSTSIDKSEASDLKENWPKKNVLSGLKGFVNIVNELEDKSSLKGEFDQSLIKILKKLFAVELGSEYKKEKVINELIRLEVIKDEDALQKLLVGQSGDKVLERKEENKPGSCATLPVQPFSVKDGSISGSSKLPKKQEREEEMKLPILGRGISNVGQSKEDSQPGTALSGATISNRSPKAKT